MLLSKPGLDASRLVTGALLLADQLGSI
ncbi:hypothetical protein HaLaN_28344 [Haematococcus lacustris]|uniref:Uncharacterized protein n=1 Tax=Haematococcus lacustris TaxID=44745 RepID=A0A6A0AA49_HAELA|nr:hypothetical protein HaLaN_28344 [Haematococcus lacustris]